MFQLLIVIPKNVSPRRSTIQSGYPLRVNVRAWLTVATGRGRRETVVAVIAGGADIDRAGCRCWGVTTVQPWLFKATESSVRSSRFSKSLARAATRRQQRRRLPSRLPDARRRAGTSRHSLAGGQNAVGLFDGEGQPLVRHRFSHCYRFERNNEVATHPKELPTVPPGIRCYGQFNAGFGATRTNRQLSPALLGQLWIRTAKVGSSRDCKCVCPPASVGLRPQKTAFLRETPADTKLLRRLTIRMITQRLSCKDHTAKNPCEAHEICSFSHLSFTADHLDPAQLRSTLARPKNPRWRGVS